MKWLTATVLQYVAGALLLACLALFARGCTLSTARDLAVAAQGKAEADRDAARTERDSWKSKTEDAQAANRAYDVIFEKQRQAAAEQQRLADEAAKTAANAVAAAQRDEAKAERENAEFRRVFGNKPKDCEAALAALDRVCPTLEGY
jgi:serine phosphatase RsbU (regulator of sigma subunit)